MSDTAQTPKAEALSALKNAFESTELADHCEHISYALDYYDGVLDADSFVDWYTETYIDAVEITYYHVAMEFLKQHDPSLCESLGRAQDLGYQPGDLNSEMLATLLLRDVMLHALDGLTAELEDYFFALEEEED